MDNDEGLTVVKGTDVAGLIEKAQREARDEFNELWPRLESMVTEEKEGGEGSGEVIIVGGEVAGDKEPVVEEYETEDERKVEEDGKGEEEGDSEGAKSKGRRKIADTWKIHRANSTGDLGDIRDWVKGDGKRKAAGATETRENKVRVVVQKKEKKDGLEALINVGFGRVMNRLDEEKVERNKQFKELKAEFSKIVKKNSELEGKLVRLEAESKADRAASNTKWKEMEDKMKCNEKERKKELDRIRKEVEELKVKLEGEVYMGIGTVSETLRKEEENTRIAEIEAWKENREKAERKNNIVIFGWSEGERVGKKDIVNFFQKDLEVGCKEENIEEVRQTGASGKIVWVKLKNAEDKRKVIQAKAKLKGKKVYIENDRTKKEREEQKELKRRAWIAKKQGAKDVKVGFGRMWVDGAAFRWDGVKKVLWEVEEGEGGRG